MSLYIGLMSGTSMDGIDAALVNQPDNQLIYGLTKAYSEEVTERLSRFVSHDVFSLAEICQLNTLIGRDFSSAVKTLLEKARVSSKEIKAIGSHGQTLCHDPQSSIPYTLQLGCGHTIASMTGIRVIADFRTKDLVNGGQGAPFAPIYHQALFSTIPEDLGLVNIGGIANVTFLNANTSPRGFDIGPGNCLMDAWIKKQRGEPFDFNGLWASQGQVIPDLLDALLSDPFFAKPTPKSIGKEYFSLNWLEQHLKKEERAMDVQATLLALTAHSIAAVLKTASPIKTLYLCGGGTHNQALFKQLSELLPGLSIQSIQAAGFHPDYLEAMMFSWFAYKTLHEYPIDLSNITGSKGPAILGAIFNS